MDTNSIDVPVLLIAFNRPETTEIVFQKIREAKPSKLYVAVDGPRSNKNEENKLVERVKDIVNYVDWPCNCYYKFNAENKGAEITVSSAIAWVFESEEYVIILEDDIVAPFSFFRYAQEMLLKYKDNAQIGLVSGCNFTPIPTKYDYMFVKYGHIGGWATWKRVWDSYSLYLEVKEEHLLDEFLNGISNSKREMKYYRRFFKQIKDRGVGNSSWDTISHYFFRANNLLTIIPRVNLTSNIGVIGLHSSGATEHHYREYDESFIVQNHPSEIGYCAEYDRNHFNLYIDPKKNILKIPFRKIMRVIKRRIL